MLTELRGSQTVTPSNSILDSVWGKEFQVAPRTVRSMGEINVDAGESAPDVEDATPVAQASSEASFGEGFDVTGKTAPEGVDPAFVESVSEVEFAEELGIESEPDAATGVNDAYLETVDDVVEVSEFDGDVVSGEPEVTFDESAPEAEIDLDGFGGEEADGSFFEPEDSESAVNPEFVEYIEDVTPVETFDAEAPAPLVDLSDTFDEGEGEFFSEEISTPEVPDPSFIESISGVSTPTETFFSEQTGGRQASAGPEINFFESSKIDGLEFDSGSGAMLEWGQPQATGPVLGPVLAPAGAEVLWIPIPNGQMLRIPLTGSGTFQVFERGYPLEEDFATAPTQGGVQDDLND